MQGSHLQGFETKSEMFEEVAKNPFVILLDTFTEKHIENDNIDNLEVLDIQANDTRKYIRTIFLQLQI